MFIIMCARKSETDIFRKIFNVIEGMFTNKPIWMIYLLPRRIERCEFIDHKSIRITHTSSETISGFGMMIKGIVPMKNNPIKVAKTKTNNQIGIKCWLSLLSPIMVTLIAYKDKY